MEKRKRGGQPGNKNALGNRGGGAPYGNKNAVRHGVYSLWAWFKRIRQDARFFGGLDLREYCEKHIRLNEIFICKLWSLQAKHDSAIFAASDFLCSLAGENIRLFRKLKRDVNRLFLASVA